MLKVNNVRWKQKLWQNILPNLFILTVKITSSWPIWHWLLSDLDSLTYWTFFHVSNFFLTNENTIVLLYRGQNVIYIMGLVKVHDDINALFFGLGIHRSPLVPLTKDQWCTTFLFSFMLVKASCLINNQFSHDVRCLDIIVMQPADRINKWLNKSEVNRWNNLNCPEQYTCRGLRL